MRFALAATLALCACTPAPKSIAPAAAPTFVYKSLSCAELRVESARLKAEEDRLFELQKKARNDNVAASVMFGLVGAAASNRDFSGEYARAQGERLAVNSVMAQRGCSGIVL